MIGKATQDCGPLYDTFQTYGGWIANPLGTDTATGGRWQRANPAATSRQAGTVPSGSSGLVTGATAGSSSHANDVDGGVTTIRPRRHPTAGDHVGSLTFRYYFAHSSNSSWADYFRAYVEDAAGHRTLVREERGVGEDRSPDLVDGVDLDGAVGRSDDPHRLRRGRSRAGEHGRGRRRRRPRHPPVSGSRTRSRSRRRAASRSVSRR